MDKEHGMGKASGKKWKRRDKELGRVIVQASACEEMIEAIGDADFAQVAGLLSFAGSTSVAEFSLLRIMIKDGVPVEPREVDWDDEGKAWAVLPEIVRSGLAEGHGAAKTFFSAMLALIDVLPCADPRLPLWIEAAEETIRPDSAEEARKLLSLVQVKTMGPRARQAWLSSVGRVLAEAERKEIEAAAEAGTNVEAQPGTKPRRL